MTKRHIDVRVRVIQSDDPELFELVERAQEGSPRAAPKLLKKLIDDGLLWKKLGPLAAMARGVHVPTAFHQAAAAAPIEQAAQAPAASPAAAPALPVHAASPALAATQLAAAAPASPPAHTPSSLPQSVQSGQSLGYETPAPRIAGSGAGRRDIR